jgi:hypothetical protein
MESNQINLEQSLMPERQPSTVGYLHISLERVNQLLLYQLLEQLNILGKVGNPFHQALNVTAMRWFVTLPEKEQERLKTQILDSIMQHT